MEIDFNTALGKTLARLTDGSLKVGIQGYDSNRWRIDEVLCALESYADFAATVKNETGYHVGPIDIWGGGQVSQAPRFLGEDPFENLSILKSAAPDLVFKCIYRGRQAFGFLPCSDDIQRTCIHEAASRGMQIFRMFDPLNDARNMVAGLHAVRDFRKTQIEAGVDPRKLVSAEALVFYVRPPENSPPAWHPSDLAIYAVQLAKMGFHEISLADYAEQITTEELASNLISTIRTALDQSDFQHVNLNFFAQGERPGINRAAFLSGAHTIDVAIGALSGGLSNTNIFPLLELVMQDHGYDINAAVWKDHPVLRKLRTTEGVIQALAERHIPYRMNLTKADSAIISRSRLAFNAVSALDSAIRKNWDSLIKRSLPKVFLEKHGSTAKAEYMKLVLEKNLQVWLDAGQFNPVSPFGYCCSFQAEALVRAELQGRPLPLGHYRQDYQDLIKGRYGKNLGTEKGRCDLKLKNALHMFEALSVLWECRDQIGTQSINMFLQSVGLEQHIVTGGISPKSSIQMHNLKNSVELADVLRTADFDVFQKTVLATAWPNAIAERLAFAILNEPFPSPKEGMQDGLRLVEQFEREEGITLKDTKDHPQAYLTEKERAAMSMILYKIESAAPYSVTKDLLRTLKGSHAGTLYGDIEADIRPFDIFLKPCIEQMTDILSKKSILNELQDSPYISAQKKLLNSLALEQLTMKEQATIFQAKKALIAHGYSEKPIVPRKSLNCAISAYYKLCEQKANAGAKVLKKCPPSMWRSLKLENPRPTA